MRGMCLAVMLLAASGPRASADDAQAPWKAPEDARKVKRPVEVTGEGLAAARKLYERKCAACHGPKGASNGPQAAGLPTPPANLSDEKMIRKASDGELFWKISTGRDGMPSFEPQLTDTQRWLLVNYVRDLSARSQYRYLGVHRAR